MTSSAQLERESEQTRSELARTLDELRERITPGQLVDQAVDYAKDTAGGEFFRNLSRQMAANPLPVVLIGAGISWLALAKRNSGPANGPAAMDLKGEVEDLQERAGTAARGVGERVSGWTSQTGEKAAAARQRACDVAGSLGESAADTTSKLADAASMAGEGAASAYESMKSGAIGRVADTAGWAGSAMARSARGLGQKGSGLGGDALAFCKGQPLLLAGLGLALGSLLGAVIPPTDAEDRLMGETSDRVKEQVRGTAEEQIDKAKTAIESGTEQAQTQAEGASVAAPASVVPQIDEDTTAKPSLD
jgi:hypothetical protein